MYIDILSSYLTEVEKYSIDECFAVVNPSDIKYAGSAEKLVQDIKDEIETKLGVTFSLGIARTKALAKTTSKLEKPNGMVLLMNEQEEEKALRKTSIDDIWVIGRRTVPRLQAMGMKTAYDFVHYPSEQIREVFFRAFIPITKRVIWPPNLSRYYPKFFIIALFDKVHYMT